MSQAELFGLGYQVVRLAPSGEWLAVLPQIHSTALCVRINELGLYRTRFCYARAIEAMVAFAIWDGVGDPPGDWIKQKPEDRLNPRWLAAAAREMHDRRPGHA